MVITSYAPNYPNDEVIGFYIYDYSMKKPKFKQDFIINIGKKNNDFVLYTRQKLVSQSSYIKDINEFFNSYGKDGNYIRSHHVELEDIPNEGKFRAFQAKALGDEIRSYGGRKKISQDLLVKANQDLKTLKENGSINPIWKKIQDAK